MTHDRNYSGWEEITQQRAHEFGFVLPDKCEICGVFPRTRYFSTDEDPCVVTCAICALEILNFDSMSETLVDAGLQSIGLCPTAVGEKATEFLRTVR